MKWLGKVVEIDGHKWKITTYDANDRHGQDYEAYLMKEFLTEDEADDFNIEKISNFCITQTVKDYTEDHFSEENNEDYDCVEDLGPLTGYKPSSFILSRWWSIDAIEKGNFSRETPAENTLFDFDDV